MHSVENTELLFPLLSEQLSAYCNIKGPAVTDSNTHSVSQNQDLTMEGESAVLHRNLHEKPHEVIEASRLNMRLSDGRWIIDSSGGAAVSCIGHGDERVQKVIASQVLKLDYCHSLFFSCPTSEDLSRVLIESTNGKMAKVFIANSGNIYYTKLNIGSLFF